MRRLADELLDRVSVVSDKKARICLSVDEERVFRSLKTTGERAIKGRLIAGHSFEAREKGHGVVMMMVMEGRHAMSVGRQVVRRFKEMGEIDFADVVKTKDGACVIVRPGGDSNA